MSEPDTLEAAADGRAGVFLIHGLGGTEYDLGSMHKRLKMSGFITHSLTLPGHGTRPEDLLRVTVEDWLDACRARYRELAAQFETLHVMGMCMGSLLAVEVAKQEQHRKGRLVVLAPPIYLDGWATPWYRDLRHLLYSLPPVRRRMRVEEEDPYGIKNEQLRGIVKAKFERNDGFHYRWVPLACVREVDRLRKQVTTELHRVPCQTLVVHAREDELTSLRSANFIVRGIGGDRARMVVLENSYHMICIDNDRELVARHVLEFFGVPPIEVGQLSDDPKMSPAALCQLAAKVCAVLEAGAWRDLPPLGIPDMRWYQPGRNRLSGIHRGGKPLRQFLAEIQSNAESARFTAFGTVVLNRGVALVPASWVARRGETALASQGALMIAMHADRVYELRWFPDDPSVEDEFWGTAPLPQAPAASSAVPVDS